MVLVDSQIPYLADFIRQFQSVEEFTGRVLTNQYLLHHNATTLFVRSTTQVNKALLENTQVTHIGTATAGTDHVDMVYLHQHHIAFADAAGSNAQAVSNYVQQALMTLQVNVSEKRVGIVGFGNVGKCLFKDLSPSAPAVLLNDPHKEAEIRGQGLAYASLPELLVASNIITLHPSYSTSGNFPSHHLINEYNVHLIPDNAILINCSRGNVISEKGLEILIQRGITLVLDVWPNEPEVRPAFVRAAAIATPHVAGHTHKAKLNGSEMMMQAFCKWFNVPVTWHQAAAPLHIPVLQENVADRDLQVETYMFRDQYLRSANAVTFDVCRKQYPLATIEH